MGTIEARPLPSDAMLLRYAGGGGYVDCFATQVPGAVSLPAFIEAFYRSAVFKLELFTVGLLFAKPWSDQRAQRLAAGELDAFSAWRVEARDERQLLMREIISDKTRLWLMVEPAADGASTRCYFGTAVIPVGVRADGSPRMSVLFSLIGFHKVYARMLLAGATSGLRRLRRA